MDGINFLDEMTDAELTAEIGKVAEEIECHNRELAAKTAWLAACRDKLNGRRCMI